MVIHHNPIELNANGFNPVNGLHDQPERGVWVENSVFYSISKGSDPIIFHTKPGNFNPK